MKKIYMKPEMEVYKMEAVNMVCESPGIGGGKATPGGGSLGKEIPDFGDIEEDFNFDNLLWKN